MYICRISGEKLVLKSSYYVSTEYVCYAKFIVIPTQYIDSISVTVIKESILDTFFSILVIVFIALFIGFCIFILICICLKKNTIQI